MAYTQRLSEPWFLFFRCRWVLLPMPSNVELEQTVVTRISASGL